MQWFQTNWFWILIGIGLLAMLLFGRRRHGSNTRSADRQGDLLRPDLDLAPPEDPESNTRRTHDGHQH